MCQSVRKTRTDRLYNRTESQFRSFKEEQELSMIGGSGKEKSEVLIHASGIDEAVLPISATYGANASGKSNILSLVALPGPERSHRAS